MISNPSTRALVMDGPALAYEHYRITLAAEKLANRYMPRRPPAIQPRRRAGQSPSLKPPTTLTRKPPGLPAHTLAEQNLQRTQPLIMDGAAMRYELHRITMAAEKLARQLLAGRRSGPLVVRPRLRGTLLETLYRNHNAELKRYVARTFGAGPPDPEDVVQAVFERYLWRVAGEPIANPVGFLVTMARNYVLDHRRRQSVRERYTADFHVGLAQADLLGPDRIVASRQQLNLLQIAIAALDPRSREILLMSRLDGLSSAEIARRKNCSPTLIKNIIAKALTTCRNALGRGDDLII